MEKQAIIDELQNWIKFPSFQSFEKDNPTIAAQIKGIKAEDLIFGERPKLCRAHIEGDVTAVGGDTKDKDSASYTRTFATGFSTQTFIHFDGEKYGTLVCDEITKLVDFAFPTAIDGPMEHGSARIALDVSKELCEKEFHRLNLHLYDTRLNEWQIVYDDDPIESNYVPIFVNLKDKKGREHKTLIGFYSEIGNEIHVSNIPALIRKQPINSSTSKSVKRNRIIIAVVAVVIVGGIVAFLLHQFGVY